MYCRLAAFALAAAITPLAAAVDFRIETRVYTGKEETPITQNTTLVANGVIYDFAENTGRVAIFREGQGDKDGRFVLIDPSRSVKTEISIERLDAAIKNLCTWAKTSTDPLVKFSAEPEFDPLYIKDTGVLTMEATSMTYRMATISVPHRETWRDLRNYFNGYAKLNCILASSLPPMPRLQVNETLELHNVVPVEVNLTMIGSPNLRAEHLFTWMLSKDDRARITLVQEQLVSFKDISNKEFQAQRVAAK
jgi:hypothetical protein